MEPKEIYILCHARSKLLANSFLEYFLPNRRAAATDYPVPELSGCPRLILTSAEELLEWLESEVNQTYSLYWNNLHENDPQMAMLFFTQDGGMIAGLVIHSDETLWLKQVATHVGGRFGYVSFEEPPPDKMDIFVEYCKTTITTKLLEGQLVPGMVF